MKIRESKNLKYDKTAKILTGGEDYDALEFQSRICILENVERMDDTLALHFKNRTEAVIKARNADGGREIDLIEKKLVGLVGHSYEEILNTEI